jgi:hypothetical protein
MNKAVFQQVVKMILNSSVLSYLTYLKLMTINLMFFCT